MPGVPDIPGPGSGLMTGARYRDPVPSTRYTPGESDQVMLSKDRSPRSESICLVERSSFCDTGSNTWLAMKGSVQQSSVNRTEDSEHVPVIPGPGFGLMTGTRYRDPVPGIRDSVPPTTPGKPGAMITPGAPGFTGHIR